MNEYIENAYGVLHALFVTNETFKCIQCTLMYINVGFTVGQNGKKF